MANRSNRSNQKINNINEFDLSQYGTIKVTTCSNLIKNQLAINAQIDQDFCPLCTTEWSKFIEPSLAVILPCQHASCAKCMSTYSKVSKKVLADIYQNNNSEEDVLNDSFCSICRHEFSPLYLDDVCNLIVKERTIESLFEYLDKLPLDKEEGGKLISKLLIDKEFEVVKVESILFNMVGMVQAECGEDLDYEQKQEYFEIARKPVKKLVEEFYDLKEQLENIFDTSSKDWQVKYSQLNNLREKLNNDKRNAAKDIFERMNSTIRMGSILDDQKNVQIDFHGLYTDEAILLIQEYVLPILSILKKIMLITGHGLHSKSGQANLKNGLKEYFKLNDIKCSDHDKNKGAIFIFQN